MVGIQVSIYPLREKSLSPALNKFWERLEERKFKFEVNSFATIIWGEEDRIFDSLKEIWKEIAKDRSIVMVVTLSNACTPDFTYKPLDKI